MTATAAREAWLRSGQEAEAGFSDFDNRVQRYDLLWRYYTNDLYDDLAAYKATRGLYRHIRSIYNPTARLVDYYVNKVWGGKLDYDGLSGGIPIETDNKAIMPALATLWKWSNWAAKKNLAIRYGACFGDLVLKVVDEAEVGGGKRLPGRGKVYLQVMHPREIKDARFDYRGNITSCVIEYIDSEPSEEQEGVYIDFTYREEITKEQFSTFRNNEPFDYYGWGEVWDNPYGFVPLVLGPHKDCGLDWGLSVAHDGRTTIDELNDQVSVFSDRMRKGNDPIWLMAGPSAPREEIDLSTTTATTTDKTGRQKTTMLYGPQGSQAHAIISDVGMTETLGYVLSLQTELERKYPELSLHELRQREQSGRALKVLYQDVIDKVIEARGNYDGALVRAQQMALSIGGLRGYFKGFGLESYDAGNEEHRIGDRPILTEALDLEAIKLGAELGMPPPKLWPNLGLGFSSEELEEMEEETAGAGEGEGEEGGGWKISAADLKQAQADLDSLGVAGGGEGEEE